MAGGIRNRSRLSHLVRSRPYPLPSYHGRVVKKEGKLDKASLASERRDWKHATCSVCMEYPHNAVLLLCSSHDKGCRPYMCGTSYRHSNCLDQFKKAYAAGHEPSQEVSLLTMASSGWSVRKKSGGMELACPLCRGQVKGWTVVEPARKYLNKKKRGCMHDGCSFVGTYKDLRKHVKAVHPRAKPREVDPVLEQKWKTLEHQREQADVISTIRATMPRSVVMGDYVIDMADTDPDSDEDDDFSDDEEMDYEQTRRGMSRNFMCFLFRESARFMRFHSIEVPETGEASGHVPVVDADAAVPMGSNDDEDNEDDDARSAAYLQALRSERRRRLRRSRRRFASSLR